MPESVLTAELGELDGATGSYSNLGVAQLLSEAYSCNLAEPAHVDA